MPVTVAPEQADVLELERIRKFLQSDLAARMMRSKRLLRENRAVAEVAAHCGFSDCSAFIGKFKRRFGVTPLKYRRESAP